MHRSVQEIAVSIKPHAAGGEEASDEMYIMHADLSDSR